MPIAIYSYAKINLGLRLGPPGMRHDGFHELRTVYQTIQLHDVVKVSLTGGKSGIDIRCDDPRVPRDESNTCWKMAERVIRELRLKQRVTIRIEKNLPVQGGLGAASSNAAATLAGIERAAKRALPQPERLRLAAEVGSDVPLFLMGGTMLGLGRGEQVYPLPDLPAMHLVVVAPNSGVSTPQAFADWDGLFQTAGNGLTREGQSSKLEQFSREVSAWLLGSSVVSGVAARGGNRAEAQLLDLVRTGIENDFERVVFPQFPEIRDVKRRIEGAGAVYASLSGSGSTVYGLFRDRRSAAEAARKLQSEGLAATATRTLGRMAYRRPAR